MAANLIDLFNNTIGDLLVKQSSEILSESAESTSTGINAILSSLLGSLIQKATTSSGVRSIMDFLIDNRIKGSFLSDATNLLSGGPETTGLMSDGAGILRFLLGDKTSAAVDIISTGSGLRTSSSMSLLKLTAPMFMDVLGRHINEKGLDERGIRTLLDGHKEAVLQSLPSGMDLLLGLVPQPAISQAPGGTSARQSTTSSNGNSLSKYLPWIVLLLTAVGLFYFVQKGCSSDASGQAEPAIADSTILVSTEPAMKSFTLPGGVTIKAAEQSFIGQLASYLATPGDENKCFVMDKVSFESGTSKLSVSSTPQLNQLLTVLKAYEDVKAEIKGHTDHVGDDSKNKELSKDRAKAIKDWLSDHYIAAGRIDAKGMGEENPVATNDTSAGRKQNNRIELCVTKK